ncbi:hypothetical protein [Fimbriiglobus ruber]
MYLLPRSPACHRCFWLLPGPR